MKANSAFIVDTIVTPICNLISDDCPCGGSLTLTSASDSGRDRCCVGRLSLGQASSIGWRRGQG